MKPCCSKCYHYLRGISETEGAITASLRAISARPGTHIARGHVEIIRKLKMRLASQRSRFAEHQSEVRA